MPSATAKRPATRQPRTVRFTEDMRGFGRFGRVDRAGGLIRNVKVLGAISSNGRIYERAAMETAVREGLYENASVFCDHPQKSKNSRSVRDLIGKLINVRLADDGIRGDLVLLRSHDLYERIIESAEGEAAGRRGFFGLSHNADGQGVEDPATKRFRVTKLTDLRSVDLVHNPASTAGLLERKRNAMKHTYEQDELAGGVATEPDMGGSWEDDVASAISKLVKASDAESHTLAKKLMGLLATDTAGAEEPTEESRRYQQAPRSRPLTETRRSAKLPDDFAAYRAALGR